MTAEIRELVGVIRRESFLAVSRATRQHEIASYVSDDLDLIVRARLVGASSGFIGELWEAYDRGEFPHVRR
jgi:predicted membrane-bound mannosyltransferase